VILLEVHTKRITFIEFEGDRPWAIDRDRISGRVMASKRMQVPSRQSESIQVWCPVQHVQALDYALMELPVDASRAAALKKLFQTSVSVALDQESIQAWISSHIKRK
jgi:hypothetical protein